MPNTTADASRPSRARRAAVTLAGATALAGLAGVCTPNLAYAGSSAEAATARSAADFSDCPPLPAGADPVRWRCEVHTAQPKLAMGKITLTLAPITMTHAEGPMPDGTKGQVWGAMHTVPTAVPGGLTGVAAGEYPRQLRLAIKAEYGGRSDFYTGQFSLRFRLLNPLLSKGCTIGAHAPIDFQLKRSGPSEWVSQDPPLIKFSAYDDTFAAPAAANCGPLTAPLNRRLGLPAPSGNLMAYDAAYTFRTYDQLPTP